MKQAAPRRSFRREGEDRRRQDLIEATLDCVAERGIQGATVRAIALRAGVTAGLIRHYFPGKDELLQAAYGAMISHLTRQALASLADSPDDPIARLRIFVEANLRPPVVDAKAFTVWAGFIGLVHTDPVFAAVHREGYLGFRDELEAIVAAALAAARRPATKPELRRYAIQLNAIVDGLWIEACLAERLFAPGELVGTGLAAVEALLDLSLSDSAGEADR